MVPRGVRLDGLVTGGRQALTTLRRENRQLKRERDMRTSSLTRRPGLPAQTGAVSSRVRIHASRPGPLAHRHNGAAAEGYNAGGAHEPSPRIHAPLAADHPATRGRTPGPGSGAPALQCRRAAGAVGGDTTYVCPPTKGFCIWRRYLMGLDASPAGWDPVEPLVYRTDTAGPG